MNRSVITKNILHIVAVAIILGFLYNQISPNGISLIREEIKLEEYEAADMSTNDVDYSKIRSVKIIDAYQFYQEGATFVDSRDMWEYSDGHIKGAINFPYIEFETTHPALDKLNKEKPIVIYCSSTECGLSTKLAIELQKLGYQKLFVFEEGWDAWVEEDYPIETGKVE